MLRFADEDVALWIPGLVVINGNVILAQCEGVMMVRQDSSFGVESDLTEPSPDAHAPEGLYLDSTVVRDL
jgi:hypothetical protein